MGGFVTYLDAYWLTWMAPASAVVSLMASAGIRYATIRLLIRVVRQIAVLSLCVAFGALTAASGVLGVRV